MTIYFKFTKPVFDTVVSLIGLLALTPLLLLISVSVYLSSRGGVFYRQIRIGQNGKVFSILKFRTMYENSEGSSVSVQGEDRITPLGRLLRKYKLDELPELWNVICGDMSLVGPRPDVPGFADVLTGSDRMILKLKPGITGPASLIYINEEEILSFQKDPENYNKEIIYPHKVKINLWYYDNLSFKLDMKIIFFTLFRKNASEKMKKLIK